MSSFPPVTAIEVVVVEGGGLFSQLDAGHQCMPVRLGKSALDEGSVIAGGFAALCEAAGFLALLAACMDSPRVYPRYFVTA